LCFNNLKSRLALTLGWDQKFLGSLGGERNSLNRGRGEQKVKEKGKAARFNSRNKPWVIRGFAVRNGEYQGESHKGRGDLSKKLREYYEGRRGLGGRTQTKNIKNGEG